MNCILCNSNDLVSISHTDCKSRQHLNIAICEGCGLIQQSPIPTVTTLKQYYRSHYRLDYKGTVRPKPKHIHRSAKQAMRRLKFLNDSGITGGRLLDIGSGSGEFVAICSRAGFSAEGADPNVGYSTFAREQYQAKIQTLNLDELDGSYDVITLFHVLEHLPCPQSAFKKLHTLLRAGGHLLVEVPWGLSPTISPSNRYFKAHLYYFDTDTLKACASRYFQAKVTVSTGNLTILFERKPAVTPVSLPSPDYASIAKAEVSNQGWWRYLVHGRGMSVPYRKLKKILEERRVRHLQGSEIIDLTMRTMGSK